MAGKLIRKMKDYELEGVSWWRTSLLSMPNISAQACISFWPWWQSACPLSSDEFFWGVLAESPHLSAIHLIFCNTRNRLHIILAFHDDHHVRLGDRRTKNSSYDGAEKHECSPRERDPSSAVLLEVSYFSPILSIDSGFFKFFLTRWERLRTEDVTSVQFVRPLRQLVICDFELYKIKFDWLIWLIDVDLWPETVW